MNAIIVAAIIGISAIICTRIIVSPFLNGKCADKQTAETDKQAAVKAVEAETLAKYQKELDEAYLEQQKRTNEALQKIQSFMFDDPDQEGN